MNVNKCTTMFSNTWEDSKEIKIGVLKVEMVDELTLLFWHWKLSAQQQYRKTLNIIRTFLP